MTRALFLLPRIRPTYPTPVRLALARRNAATLLGRCACGASRQGLVPESGTVGQWVMRHENECVAHDDYIATLLTYYRISALVMETVVAELDLPAGLTPCKPMESAP